MPDKNVAMFEALYDLRIGGCGARRPIATAVEGRDCTAAQAGMQIVPGQGQRLKVRRGWRSGRSRIPLWLNPAVRRTGFYTLITENRRVEILRRAARLTIRVIGNALTEPEARRVGIDHLDSGEQLLACIERDGTAALSYTFHLRGLATNQLPHHPYRGSAALRGVVLPPPMNHHATGESARVRYFRKVVRSVSAIVWRWASVPPSSRRRARRSRYQRSRGRSALMPALP